MEFQMQDINDGKEEIELELDEDLHQTLIQIAAERGVTIDEVVEGFLQDAIDACKAQQNADPQDPS
jgi:hypothetical protein